MYMYVYHQVKNDFDAHLLRNFLPRASGKKIFSPIYLKSNANESSPLIRLLYLERPYNRVMRRKRIDEIRNADHDCTIEINRVRVQI